ncbi:unnamed protein product [Pleuronectes platessa]|uniref:Uncharacterized protein n=1 Tax=Pleuronectes platessa TaxID=8262 RepID=A0A9N7UZD3_PLEPL|nr:unnamed protein product [Pleuronectes platessa]
MHAGGGMGTEDMDRSMRCRRGALLAAKGPSRAAAVCWASSALRRKKVRCITTGVLVPERLALIADSLTLKVRTCTLQLGSGSVPNVCKLCPSRRREGGRDHGSLLFEESISVIEYEEETTEIKTGQVERFHSQRYIWMKWGFFFFFKEYLTSCCVTAGSAERASLSSWNSLSL